MLDSVTTPGDVVVAAFNSIDPEIVMEQLQPLTETQIHDIIKSMPKKSCALDPISIYLLISYLDVLLPVISPSFIVPSFTIVTYIY